MLVQGITSESQLPDVIEASNDDDGDENAFSPAILRSIAKRVARGVVALQDSTITPPAASAYWNGDILVDDEARSLMVDVALGGISLTIHAGTEHLKTAPADDGAALAALIVTRVTEFSRERAVHSRRLRQLRRLVRDRLASEVDGMKLVEVGCAAVPAEESILGSGVRVAACIELLDATLRPYRCWVGGSDPSEVTDEIDDLLPGQRRRELARGRLQESEAVIEIDAIAEQAIAAAGRSLGGVAADLMRLHARDECDYPYPIRASGGALGITLSLEDGCIVAQLEVPGKVIVRGRRLQLYQALPLTAAIAAIGRPAIDIVGMEALTGVATIVGQSVAEREQRTYFTMDVPRRPVRSNEIGRGRGLTRYAASLDGTAKNIGAPSPSERDVLG